jgi:hypothetical protein
VGVGVAPPPELPPPHEINKSAILAI